MVRVRVRVRVGSRVGVGFGFGVEVGVEVEVGVAVAVRIRVRVNSGLTLARVPRVDAVHAAGRRGGRAEVGRVRLAVPREGRLLDRETHDVG